ncbi:MAG: hypothetical protein COB14_07485 [Alphaproteobacteria bacterium]|nr:MAG: hypothetical protein COB14_07485 [Alphaproteobacteria bacterium]
MSDQICVNARKLFHIVLCEGGTMEDAQEAYENLRQPAQGYFSVTDIYEFIRNRRIEKCKK